MHSSMSEMVFLLLLALVVVGPKKLPGLARQMGKYMAEFKRASNEFKRQLESEMMNIELEESAKTPKILPPENKSWEPAIRPDAGVVSRGEPDAISKPDPEELKPEPTVGETPPNHQPRDVSTGTDV
jgi:sec-independent protein translocase protein TatB